jgi:DNA processing protein
MSLDTSSQTISESQAAALQLALVPGVGPRTRRKLLERFGSPTEVLAAAPSDLRTVPGVGPKLCRAISTARTEIDVAAEIERCRQGNVNIVCDYEESFPRLLSEFPDPPGVLFVRGQILPTDALAVGVVGARHATQYGLMQAERLAGNLARAGLTVVSGLARGIDAAAHRGALAAGGRTIAVLASGVLNVFPPEHNELAEQIAARGAVISESPPKFAPLAGMFPQRNRIISGLSLDSPHTGNESGRCRAQGQTACRGRSSCRA